MSRRDDPSYVLLASIIVGVLIAAERAQAQGRKIDFVFFASLLDDLGRAAHPEPVGKVFALATRMLVATECPPACAGGLL